MIRSNTYPELSKWIKEPIHTGSVYIKPTREEDNYCIKCFSYLYYFLSCGCIR